jgi:preprotein translocase subunit SecD
MASISNRCIRQLALTAIISLFLTAPCLAESLSIEIDSAGADYEQRTGRPTLTIAVTGVSKQVIYYFSINNIGRKIELRIDGKTVLSPFIREPLIGRTIQVTGNELTVDRIRELVDELSKPGIRVEIDTPSE